MDRIVSVRKYRRFNPKTCSKYRGNVRLKRRCYLKKKSSISCKKAIIVCQNGLHSYVMLGGAGWGLGGGRVGGWVVVGCGLGVGWVVVEWGWGGGWVGCGLGGGWMGFGWRLGGGWVGVGWGLGWMVVGWGLGGGWAGLVLGWEWEVLVGGCISGWWGDGEEIMMYGGTLKHIIFITLSLFAKKFGHYYLK